MRFHEAIHGIYFDDLDALQILHNSRYLLLFERTIGSFWARVDWKGSPEGGSPDRKQLVRANHVEYLRPVSQIGDVRVRIWVEHLGRTSLTFAFRMLPMDEDVDYATGTRVMVSVDPRTKRPVPWSDEFRHVISPFLREEKAAAT
jgi:acyl-CoA thioester hydrolase